MIRWSPAAPAHPSCPHGRLSRLLAAELPEGVVVTGSTLRPWASANFVGARHIFSCMGRTSLIALQQRLTDIEWRLRGHIVADMAVEPVGEDGDFRIEVLTVED